MTIQREPDEFLLSTRWVPKRDTITPGAAGTRAVRPKADPPQSNRKRPHRFLGLTRWPRHHKLTITVQWKGGAECYYLVESRGCSQIFPGVLAIHDVMSRVYSER